MPTLGVGMPPSGYADVNRIGMWQAIIDVERDLAAEEAGETRPT